jgi:hypothetical protein
MLWILVWIVFGAAALLLVQSLFRWTRASVVGSPSRTLADRTSTRAQTSRAASRPTTPRSRTIYYRAKDGQTDYGFSFERVAGSYRVYIVRQPGYGDRSADCDSTHRLTDKGRNYICWTGVLLTEEDARKLAKLWAECTQEYLRIGKSFEATLKDLKA